MGFKELFKKAPSHDFEVGDLVTCSCHGGLAIILRIFDGVKERIWMHTITRLKKTTSENYAPKNFAV